MPGLFDMFSDPRDTEWEEAQMAAESVIHGSDPDFVPKVLHVNEGELFIELGPRMTRVYNRHFDPDDAGDCRDYGHLMEIEYIGEEETLQVRLRCRAEPLAFPRKIILEALDPGWEMGRKVYGRMEFEGLPYLPVRGWRRKETCTEDKSLICLNRFERACPSQPVNVEVGQAVQPSANPAVPIVVLQQPQVTPVSGAVVYPLQVGRITVYDAEWDLVKFQNAAFTLSPEMKKAYKAVHELGAISEGTAKTTMEILSAARIQRTKRSLSNVLCPSGVWRAEYARLYAACISKVEQRPPKYYLTQ